MFEIWFRTQTNTGYERFLVSQSQSFYSYVKPNLTKRPNKIHIQPTQARQWTILHIIIYCVCRASTLWHWRTIEQHVCFLRAKQTQILYMCCRIMMSIPKVKSIYTTDEKKQMKKSHAFSRAQKQQCYADFNKTWYKYVYVAFSSQCLCKQHAQFTHIYMYIHTHRRREITLASR